MTTQPKIYIAGHRGMKGSITILGEKDTVRIGAGAVVNKDVPDFALMVGVPAKQIGWMSRFGEQLNLPLHGNVEAICPSTSERYILNGNVCKLITS
jgi:serine acetyltransferase